MCNFFAGNDMRIFLHVLEESKMSAACYRMRSFKSYMSLNRYSEISLFLLFQLNYKLWFNILE